MIRRFLATSAGLAVSIVLAGCGSGTSQAPSSAPSSAASQGAAICEQAAADADFAGTVKIKNFTMSPGTVKIKVGEAIAWTNDDSAPHTATLDSVDCSTDNISTGTTAKLTFNVAGTYAYHCRIHSSMKGFTVEVTP